jgi:hypothetical protein
MTTQHKHQPGDIILDRYVPHLEPGDREIARERLREWMRWKLQIIMRQVREEMQLTDSREDKTDDRMDSASPPSP